MPGPRRYRLKDGKLYEGERRIIRVLFERDHRFTELAKNAHLDETSLAAYLIHLQKGGVIEKDKASGFYHFPRAVQPLEPKSYPKAWENLNTIIGDIQFYATRISSVEKPAERQAVLADFLHTHFSLLATNLVFLIDEACSYDDPKVADDFIRRSLEAYFIQWIYFLYLACFCNREERGKSVDQVIGSFLRVAEATYKRVLKRLNLPRPSVKQTGSTLER